MPWPEPTPATAERASSEQRCTTTPPAPPSPSPSSKSASSSSAAPTASRAQRVNAYIAQLEVDFVFADQRLAVETDSWRFPHTRNAFERDRERDAILTRAGYRPLRSTPRQLPAEPRTVAATLDAALGG